MISTLLITTLVFLGQTLGHGYISLPAATYRDSYTKTKFNAVINEQVNPVFMGHKWNDSPEANTKMFTQCFQTSGISSLKALIDPIVPDCGNTRIDVAPVNVSSLNVLEFRNDEYHEGFISSHHGPCEIWIDQTRIVHYDDCRAHFTSYPAIIPIKYTHCPVPCLLSFYWLALHEPQWQIYKQCVLIHS